MVIYKPNVGDRKSEKKELAHSTVTVPEDVQPLAVKGKKKEGPVSVLIVPLRRRRHPAIVFACVMVLVLMVIVITAVGGFFLYNHLMTKKFCTARIRYYEYASESRPRKRRIEGTFLENVEIDMDTGIYERLDVPPILDSMRSTIVHDFEKNLTAIVDRDHFRCFVLPLNRTAVKPPTSFLDLLAKYKAGYYLPDAELVRDEFKVQLPAVDDVEPFGFYIWYDCHQYATYRLVHDDVQHSISKRSTCKMAGDKYCLGDAGVDKIICLTLTGCT